MLFPSTAYSAEMQRDSISAVLMDLGLFCLCCPRFVTALFLSSHINFPKYVTNITYVSYLVVTCNSIEAMN